MPRLPLISRWATGVCCQLTFWLFSVSVANHILLYLSLSLTSAHFCSHHSTDLQTWLVSKRLRKFSRLNIKVCLLKCVCVALCGTPRPSESKATLIPSPFSQIDLLMCALQYAVLYVHCMQWCIHCNTASSDAIRSVHHKNKVHFPTPLSFVTSFSNYSNTIEQSDVSAAAALFKKKKLLFVGLSKKTNGVSNCTKLSASRPSSRNRQILLVDFDCHPPAHAEEGEAMKKCGEDN